MPKALDLFPNRNTIFHESTSNIYIYFFSEKSWFAVGDTGTWRFIYKLGLNGSSSWSRSFTKMQMEKVMLAWVYEVKITTSVLARPNGAWQQYNDALSPSTCPKWINTYKTRVYSCVHCSTNLKISTQCKIEKVSGAFADPRGWHWEQMNLCTTFADTGRTFYLMWQLTSRRAREWSRRARQELQEPFLTRLPSHTPLLSLYSICRSGPCRREPYKLTRRSGSVARWGLFETGYHRIRLKKETSCRKNMYLYDTGISGKEPTCQCRRNKRCGFDPCIGKVPWRRAR